MFHPTGARLGVLAFFVALVAPSVSFADRPEGMYGTVIRAPHEIYRLARVKPDLLDQMDCSKLSSGIDGRYKSNCSLQQKEGRNTVDVDGKLQYTVYDKRGATKVEMDGKMKGDARVSGNKLDAQATMKGKDTVTPGEATVPMKWTFKLCLENGGKDCESGRFPSQIPLATSDGRWALMLNILPPPEGKRGKKLKGNATLSFADGKVHEYAIKGEWDPKKDKSTIVLEATRPKKGGKVMIKNAVASSISMSMEGKLVYDLYGHDGKLNALFFQTTSPPMGN